MNVLVTGGSRGIGLGVAQRLAAAGHGVTLCARNTELLEARAKELPVVRDQQVHDIWSLDMADLNAVSELQGCPRTLPNYSAFINCAGIAGAGLLMTQSISGIDKTLATNLHAPILLAKHFVRAMIRSKGNSSDVNGLRRHLIFMSSVLGSRGYAGSSVYSATKAGIEGFARSLAREVGSRNIAVNCIAPGLVDTEMGVKADTKLLNQNVFPGFVSVDAVVDSVMFVLNSQSITGSTLTVNNGCAV